MNDIIDKVKDLLALSREELDEKLLEDKYNKANLRQLIRECLKVISQYKGAYEYQVTLNEKLEQKLEKAKKFLSHNDENTLF